VISSTAAAQAHHRVLELLEGAVAVVLRRHLALPAVVGTETDVERVVVADAARQHGLNGHGHLQKMKKPPEGGCREKSNSAGRPD
jgi:hypothetical protein